MRDDDLWNRGYRRHPVGDRNFWDDHAAAMELLTKGNQMWAHEIVDRLGCLWQNLRRWFVALPHNTGPDRHLP